MSREITTAQLQENMARLLADRCKNIDPAAPNLRFCPTLEECDGPGRTILLRYNTYGWMANPMGVTHGGIVAAILDASMGTLCYGIYQVLTPTITMTTNYNRPVPLDCEVYVRARATYPGGSSCQLTAEMFLPGQEGEPLATAMGVYHTAHADRK